MSMGVVTTASALAVAPTRTDYPSRMLLLTLLACSEPTPLPAPEPQAATAAPPPARTPLLLITLDTTRADRIGTYGHAPARTPTLDALAARGARFDRAYTPTPLTIPAHASLHTGLYPPRHGVRDNGDQRLSDEAVTLAERLSAAGYTCHAATAAFVTQAEWGFAQGFAAYRDDLGVPTDRLSWRVERPADAVIDDALVSLSDGADCLWVHLFDAHTPYAPPAGFADFEHPYDGEIAWMDSQLKRLLAAAPEGALVAVAGDHGEGFGEGGEESHGMLLTEGALRVPLILAGPGVPAGEVVEYPVSLTDVAPTLLRLLDVPLTEPAMDGVDLLTPPSREGVYSETLYGHYHFGWSPLRAVTTADGRLTRGLRDEGAVGDEAAAWMDGVAEMTPTWALSSTTLDQTELEQLIALGYVAQPVAPSESTASGDVDPRDGVALLKRLHGLARVSREARVAGLRALLTEAPGMREARVQLGLTLARSGQVEAGISELVEAWTRQPDSTLAVNIGQLWLQSAVPEEALSWFREASERDPKSLSARAGEVSALVQIGRPEEAAAVAELMLNEAPDHAELLLARAELALARGEPLEPWVAPLMALATERPFHPRALQLAGRVLWLTGDPEQGEALLTEELRWRPANLSARLDLATLFAEQGRWVNVIKTLRPLLNLQPDEPRWQVEAARAYLAMDRPDLAEPHIEACAGHPRCPE